MPNSSSYTLGLSSSIINYKGSYTESFGIGPELTRIRCPIAMLPHAVLVLDNWCRMWQRRLVKQIRNNDCIEQRQLLTMTD